MKTERVGKDGFQIEASTLEPLERFSMLERKQGVSEMIMSIYANEYLKINGADKSDMRDLERKFNQTNSNMSQLRDLSEGKSFEHKGKTYSLEALCDDFFKVRVELGKEVNKILEKKTLNDVNDGPLIKAMRDFGSSNDTELLKDRVTFVTNLETEQKLREDGSEIKPALRQLMKTTEVKKEGAPINDPQIIEALQIYQRLNKNIGAAHLAIKENKSPVFDLYKAISQRKNEAIALVKKIRGLK
ncbi:hypothetical protein [Pseudomonas sp. ATCC PTA-122608]|uniref:hypothetical protein n=1 Tax=Pseudomonas sp. ATCC PTA-122608 TaxID=1771311 RepID=UPI001179FD75|nr:hypothetical protein [Pseudomonas sp. ATCC PTA-122608]